MFFYKKVFMIVIDTMVLYNYLYNKIGLTLNPRVNYLNLQKMFDYDDVYITTASITEFIVRLKGDLNKQKICLDLLLSGKVKIIRVSYLPFVRGHPDSPVKRQNRAMRFPTHLFLFRI